MKVPFSAFSQEPSGPVEATRVPAIDAGRGAALALMVVYHFCWDLNFLGLARFDLLSDPWWLAFRTVILALFLGLVGVSLTLACRGGLVWPRLLRRVAVIAAAAAAVTAVSAWFTPDAIIQFGVLHHIALASLLGLAFIRLPLAMVAAAAVLCLAAPEWAAQPGFDSVWLRWTGLGVTTVRSNDFVPLLPWFSLVLAGVMAARLWLMSRVAPSAVREPAGGLTRGLVWAGRRSLALYLVHQPVLLGVLWLAAGAGPGPLSPVAAHQDQGAGFLASCQLSCRRSGAPADACVGYCRCVFGEIQDSGLWPAARDNRLDTAGANQVVGLAQACAARSLAKGLTTPGG